MSSDVKYKVRLRAQFGDIGPLEVPGTYSVESLAAKAFESWPKGTIKWTITIFTWCCRHCPRQIDDTRGELRSIRDRTI
jgi:hypothetical protein